ncbi:hypothetical protein NDU88_004985 [Pleurodeles waltl]|uniref:Uncharacterized protein n=1 Tax=Pleurodeles waltl TaxID=8319 RepID=A0AAV7TU24_PLEWA|nr:hypothetical protein NDU88_004985 [Pleurodeles waltl]
MVTQKLRKKDSNLRDLFAKTPVTKQDPTRVLGSDPRGGSGDGTVDEDANPELAMTVKELKGELTELGQRVDTIERTCDRQEEDLDLHRQEIIALQDSIRDLQYRLEDLEDRS